jgi:hypothetical protein
MDGSMISRSNNKKAAAAELSQKYMYVQVGWNEFFFCITKWRNSL